VLCNIGCGSLCWNKSDVWPDGAHPQSPRIFPRISTIPKTRRDRGWRKPVPIVPVPLSLCQWKTIFFSYFGNYETDRKWSCLLRTRSKVEGKMLSKKRFNSTTGKLNRTCLRSIFDTGVTPVHVACILQVYGYNRCNVAAVCVEQIFSTVTELISFYRNNGVELAEERETVRLISSPPR